ncbi:MAG TPA: alpha-ketoglutarate-dependent dioxygenase AlkB [Steroidobacteraceae bacterium]|nr:alpha-ketoglutarate-dependent dioxygenase AlkB [Steroidobacteraceae bacterium]
MTATVQGDLLGPSGPSRVEVDEGVLWLRGYVATAPLLQLIAGITARAPFRHLTTPGGGRMSVAMTNAGRCGWFSDTRGYRYTDSDPLSGQPWPPMPASFQALAAEAAAVAGFGCFEPDCCLVNRYEAGAQMGTHRDYDERDLGQPIVSVSIGHPAVFLWYGATRKGPPRRIPVVDGDVLVWGGRARPGYHGVRRLAGDAGALRYNLTFRRAR